MAYTALNPSTTFPVLFPIMASILTRQDSRFFIASFQDAQGRWLKRSTKVPLTPKPGDKQRSADLKRSALAIAHEFETAARTQRTARQTREVIADLHESLTKEHLPQRSVRDAVASWLARKAPEVADATIVFYRASMAKFLSFIGDAAADGDFNLVTRDTVTRYRNDMAAKLSPVSVNHDLAALRQLCKDARRDGVLISDPAEFVDKVKKAKNETPRRPFSREELAKVLAGANDEWRSMVMFGLYTGQRLGDIASFRWDYLDMKAGVIVFTSAKTGRNMTIPIAAPLRQHIEGMTQTKGLIHPSVFALTRSARSNQFAVLLADVGLRSKTPYEESHGNGRNTSRGSNDLSFHCLRHTAVTLLKEAGVSAAFVMEIIGHDSVAMSQHYTHIGIEALAGAMAKMPDVAASA